VREAARGRKRSLGWRLSPFAGRHRRDMLSGIRKLTGSLLRTGLDFTATAVGARLTMSIYRTRNRRPDQSDMTEPVTGSGTPAPARTPPSDHWASVRKAKPVDYMLPKSVNWLEGLPQAVRPLAVVTKYARIANMLALEWSKPAACRAYFDDLLIDCRGNRQGFPADVDRDLRRLRDYYHSLHLTLDK